jgi:hypothetical protein
MSMVNASKTLPGSCHCGRLSVEFSTAQEPAGLHPRACDCSFCRKHGAAWISDPAGALSLSARGAASLREYRQGSESARFLLCAHCGVLVAVVYEQDGCTYGALNAGCLDGEPGLAEAVSASPQRLSAEEKIARWRQVWVPDVVLATTDQ